MPELPEVEATRENLERWLRGRTIRSVQVLDRRVLRGQEPRALERALRGARLTGVERRGKHLLLDFGRRRRVLAHLGMTGKFLLREEGQESPRAVCISLDLARGRRVVYSDLRRFGRFGLLDREGERTLSELGVEPLSPDFTPRRLAELLQGSRLPLKLFLMDQTRVAGLGNIQAAEALHAAGLHPAFPASRLGGAEAARLHRAIRRVLRENIDKTRAPEITYLEERGAENTFRVYGREGEPCPRCRTRIRRFVQGGRSSYFCPRCQPPLRPGSPRGPASPGPRGRGRAPGARGREARRARRGSRPPRRR